MTVLRSSFTEFGLVCKKIAVVQKFDNKERSKHPFSIASLRTTRMEGVS